MEVYVKALKVHRQLKYTQGKPLLVHNLVKTEKEALQHHTDRNHGITNHHRTISVERLSTEPLMTHKGVAVLLKTTRYINISTKERAGAKSEAWSSTNSCRVQCRD